MPHKRVVNDCFSTGSLPRRPGVFRNRHSAGIPTFSNFVSAKIAELAAEVSVERINFVVLGTSCAPHALSSDGL